ncbi:DUF1336 domain-containing protein [Cephalotus follicularis]|uniref:DUF1336 domain-containing protein n=1 Tax=Cephalotus follicularis TaxID=3775 RepID=A0A1Q3BYJ8_CEPFO|nr:DUF1336 domain-containing protein [Cephalotus follicularis]
MGACPSKRVSCVDWPSKKRKKKPKRRRLLKRRVSSLKLDDVDSSCGRRSANSIVQGSGESMWFDCFSMAESESVDEFYSYRDDTFSTNESKLSISSSRDFDRTNHYQKQPEILLESGEVAENVEGCNSQLKSNNINNELAPVIVDEVSNVSAGGDGAQALNHCGLLPHVCLPCLASAVPSLEKTPITPSSKKKVTSRLSFKWREGHTNSIQFSPKSLLQRPVAGSSVPFCPLEKKMLNCWTTVEPRTFKVRGQNYFRDKKKDFADNCAAFHPFGVDAFLSQRKINHIARFVELPVVNPSKEIPSILVVNIQIPLYPATIFQSEYDGEGMNLVLYFKLSEGYSKVLPFHFKENIIRIINDEVERVKSFPVDTIASFRERLKLLFRLTNMEDLHLSTAEKKLINAYNEKPILSRPQHEFYLGENYFEIDLDMHRFSYMSRKGFEAFQERFKLCILDFGLTIQGNKSEDLPENILCCIRLNEIDYTKCSRLEF